MKIGLIGEAPNDTESIKYLLEKKYDNSIALFVLMLNRIHGSQLDSQKTKRLLRNEYEDKCPDIVVFIRDLDGLSSNKSQLTIRKEYFTESNSVVDKKGIFLLNIYEIEALILADIECFNKLYSCNASIPTLPMLIEEPKEFLKVASNSYNESDNPDIFKELNFGTVLSNCEYFETFIKKLDKLVYDKTHH